MNGSTIEELSSSKDKNSENENSEDLLALLDDALKDFETGSTPKIKVHKRLDKETKLFQHNIQSKTKDASPALDTKCVKGTTKSGSAQNKSKLQSSLNSKNIGKPSQQQPGSTPSTIPTEKELEDMFNDLMKAASDKKPDDVGNTEFENVLPMMENMMQSLLSAEILYPPLKELCNKYPDWLAENRQSLKHKEYDNYNKQCILALFIIL